MSNVEQLQQKLKVNDTLLQQTSTISQVRWQDSDGESRIGSRTLTLSEIATAKELQSSENLKD